MAYLNEIFQSLYMYFFHIAPPWVCRWIHLSFINAHPPPPLQEARQCHVDSEELRGRFHAIDCDGSGGLDFEEFEEFISDYVCMTEVEEKAHEEEEKQQHDQGLLTLKDALTIYILEQVGLH